MLASSVSRESLLRVVKTLPAAPQILARLGQLLFDPVATLDDIAEPIRRDAALTANVIRMANSVAYAPAGGVATLEEALARVGLMEAYRLTGFAAAAQLAERRLALYGVSSALLRENSLLVALTMEALAPTAGLDPRAAYTAGLLRSIGKIALDRLMAGRDDVIDYMAGGESPLGAWETEVAGLGNCEAAAIILDGWRFPEETLAAIRDHYAPGPEAAPMSRLLNLAAGAAERCGHAFPGEHHYFGLTQEKLAELGLGVDVFDEATRQALQRFGPIRTALS